MRVFSSRTAFTLLETVVVMMTITTAAGMAALSLSRAREGSRTDACLRNLGQFGQAISMYVPDNQGYLPGPIHPNVPWNAARLFMSNGSQGTDWYRLQLPSYLAPYTSSKTPPTTPPADTLAYCPTAAGIPTVSSAGQPWYYAPKSFYVANTGAVGGETSGATPYHTTSPIHYFGRINLGTPISFLTPSQMPKQLSTIPNVSREWALADLWYWEAGNARGAQRVVGTWPYATNIQSSETIANQGLKIPSYPFHQTRKTYSSTLGTDPLLGSPRLTTGRTNAVYLDAHAASVQNWQGTVNPCFSPNPCN